MKSPPPLRRYLYYQLGLMAVVQLLIVAALVWTVLLPRMRTDIGIRQQALARTIAGQVSAHLAGGERQLTALTDYLGTGYDPSPFSLNAFLDTQCGDGEFFETICLIDFNNKTITDVGLSRKLRTWRSDMIGLNLSGRAFLDLTMEADRTVWSDTFLSTVSSRLAVAVARPSPRGIVMGEITIDHLSEFISNLPLEPGLFAMILDRRGTVVADSQKVWSGRQLSAEIPLAVDQNGPDSFASNMFDLGGRRLVGTVVPIGSSAGWRVLVAQTYRNAYQPIRSTIFTIAVGLIVALVLAMLLSWFQARKLSHTFHVYGEKAQALANGQYDVDWPQPKNREFALLAENLRHMADVIGRREQQLVSSENNLRTILDSIGDGVIATDDKGIVTRLNPMAEHLTGWSLEEAVGRPLSEVFRIIDSKTRQVAVNPVEKVLAEGGIIGLANHTMLISKDGGEYQIADSGAPIRQSDGRVVGVVLVFRDVTEAYAREQIIRDNEQRLKNLTANVPGVVYMFEVTTGGIYRNTYVSERASEIFGIPAQPGTFFPNFTARIPDDEKEIFLSSVDEAVENERPWSYEGRFLKNDEEIIWFSGNSVPYRVEDNLVFYGVLTDITERKKWESSLAASERRFKDLFNEAPVMYVITHNRNNYPIIQDVNNTFLETLGYTREELLNTPLANYYTEKSRKELLERGGYQRALMGNFLSEERDFIAKDGSLVHTLLHATPEYDDSGLLTGTRAMFLDVTARKKAEKEARRLQNALLQAQKMEAIGTLAGGIAHDFNNILSAVIGYAELALASTEKESRLHKNLEQILKAGLRASELVSQILTFSRQEEPELKPLQAGPLVKEALKLLRSSLPTTIEMTQDISSDVDNIMADPTEIYRIVMNLCTNAAQAMGNNGGVMAVTLTQVDLTQHDTRLHPGLKPGRYVKLSVQDNGPGIPEELKDRIFEPYFTTKEKGKGTGMGLSVVHGIVQSYGGGIHAYSEPDAGTIFNVYLPAIKYDVSAEQKAEQALPTGREHILLVDDEPVLVDVGRELLETLGYKVTGCHSGSEALELFEPDPGRFDLVISDMTMPKMTGDKLAEELLQTRKDLPIILFTGFTQMVNEEKAAEIGVKALALKPMVKEKLAHLVRKVLDKAEADR
jgi:PAS domain S-box-containing protein